MGNSSMSSLHCFLSRKRLEPLPEEDDTSGNSKNQVGWWWQRLQPAASNKIDEEGQRRDEKFEKLSHDDELFRMKMLEIHRKLSDVDDDDIEKTIKSVNNENILNNNNDNKLLDSQLKTTFIGNSRDENQLSMRMLERRRLRKMDLDVERRRHLEELRKRAERIDEVSEEDQDDIETESPQENTFLKNLWTRRRGIKILSLLSHKKTNDAKSNEERTSQLMKIYVPDKCGKGKNTISIDNSTRNKKFWKIRTRRSSSSSDEN